MTPHSPTSPQLGPLTGALALISLVLGISIFAKHTYDAFTWSAAYDGVTRFGDSCAVGTARWPGDFTAAFSSLPPLSPQKLPYRGTPNPPVTAAGDYLYARCDISLGKIPEDAYPLLSLGPVFGRSQVRIDGIVRVESPVDGTVELPLTPAERARDRLVLEVVSVRTVKANPGMATLLPPFLATSRPVVDGIRQRITALSTEHPLYRSALTGALVSFFIILWLAGLRFADVRWMIAMASAVALQNVTAYVRSFVDAAGPLFRIESALNFTFGLTCLLYCLSELRLLSEQSRKLPYVFALGILAFGTAIVAMPEQTFFAWRMLSRTPAVATIVLLAGGSLWAFPRIRRDHTALPPHAQARVRRLGILAGATAAACALEIYLEDRSAAPIRPLSQLLTVTAYATVLLVDLARRQAAYFREVERRIVKEREAEEARSVSRAAQMLAHDIRRPFNMVRVFHDRILGLERAADVATFRERLLPEIIRQQERIDGMLAELVSVGAEMVLEREDADAGSCLVRALATFDGVPKARHLALDFAAEPCRFHGDRRRVERVLENLIENAIHAADDDGRLSFSVARRNDGLFDAVEIGVRNSGSFIEPEARERVFDFAFTRGKATGSGLGLAIARRVVVAHGGRIWCESDRETGTVFRLTLPYAGPGAPASFPARIGAALPDAAPVTRVAKAALPLVFLVEDDELQALGWEMLMKDATLAVYTSPDAALAALASGGEDPALFLLDFEFAGARFTGAELATEIRRQRPEALIAMTSNRTLSVATAGPVDAILSKTPRTYAELRSEIAVNGAAAGASHG